MMENTLAKLQQQLTKKKVDLTTRFEEIARMTEQLEAEQREIDALEKQIAIMEQQAQVADSPLILELTDEQREGNRGHIELIQDSNLFDAEWYLATYPDIANSEEYSQNPAAHYTLFGGFEGRKPCPEFDSSYYLQANRDVADAAINPLAHYLRFGRDEGRAFVAPMDDE